MPGWNREPRFPSLKTIWWVKNGGWVVGRALPFGQFQPGKKATSKKGRFFFWGGGQKLFVVNLNNYLTRW